MLRIYFIQHWFNLADEAREEAPLHSTALRRFVGIDLGRERAPDGTTQLKFRRLLEQHKLGEALFAKVREIMQARNLKLGTSTIVDASIWWHACARSGRTGRLTTPSGAAGRLKMLDSSASSRMPEIDGLSSSKSAACSA